MMEMRQDRGMERDQMVAKLVASTCSAVRRLGYVQYKQLIEYGFQIQVHRIKLSHIFLFLKYYYFLYTVLLGIYPLTVLLCI